MSLEDLFPHLPGAFEITSDTTCSYNCIAWALGYQDAKWDPTPWYYWPRGVPRNHAVSTICAIFSSFGFVACGDGDLQAGWEKIAIFSRDGANYTHVARQLPDGRWTSKLGNLEDIAHDNCAGLSGEEYGQVLQWMKRNRESPAT
jgi:hypothetical protein